MAEKKGKTFLDTFVVVVFVDTVTPKAKQYQDVTRLSRDSKLELCMRIKG